MKIRFIYFLIVLMSLFNGSLMSQTYPNNVPDLQKVIPPSPNAASLGRYSEWPVSLYTGVPNISIPIYEVKAGKISVPISLNYHASGIRVGEIASWVGLGFSLNAGGVISRSLRGVADDIPNAGFLSFRNQFPQPGDLTVINSNTPFSDIINVASQGGWDTEPDFFSFNALGFSFSFYFDGNNIIIAQPYNNIKLNTDPALQTFTAKLEDGTILLFGGNGFTELTNANVNNVISGANNFISSWYLKSIITTNGETISFQYYNQTVEYNGNFTETDYLFYQNNQYGAQTTLSCDVIPAKEHFVNFSSQTVIGLSLASIETTFERIIFQKNTSPRLDNNGDTALASIKFFSKAYNQYLKEYRFVYSYTDAFNSICVSGKSQGIYAKRLHLEKLQEFQANGAAPTKEWKFSYNPTRLPARGSFAQDHWGYFNGSTTNTTLLPSSPGFTLPNHRIGNRDPNENYTQAEVLQKIVYPTGGTSSFEFEQNRFVSTEEVLKDTALLFSYNLDYNSGDNTTQKTGSFTVTREQNVSLLVSGYYTTAYLNLHNPCSSRPVAYITGSNGFYKEVRNCNGSGATSQNITLSPGTYTFGLSRDLIADHNDPNHSSVSARLNYQVSKGVQTFDKLVGGLRIKKITYSDSVNVANNSVQIFQYYQPYIIAPVNPETDYLAELYEQIKMYNNGESTRECVYTTMPLEFQKYLVRSSVSKFTHGSIQGGVIGYGQVITLYGPNGENGKTISNFTNFPDKRNEPGLPYTPSTGKDWRRGLLKSAYSYNSNGTLLSRDSNLYEFEDKGYITTYKLGSFKVYFSQAIYSPGQLIPGVVYKYYDIISERVKHLKAINILYGPNGSDSIVTVKSMYYDNPLHGMVTRTQQINSTRDTILTEVKYPLDNITGLTTTASAAKDIMVERNIINPPLVQSIFKNNTLLAKTTNNYKFWWNNQVLPDNIEVQLQNNPSEQRLQFLRYDTNGNLITQRKANGESHSYIWDYQKKIAIAEVINADSASIAYTSFEADGKGGWNFSGIASYFGNAPTGSNVYDPANGLLTKNVVASGNYIVSYWSRSNQHTVNGSTGTAGVSYQSWTYYEHVVTVAVNGIITVAGGGIIDELRCYPAGAFMTTYVHMPGLGVLSQCDANNRITYYSYDGFGRLNMMKDQEGNVLKMICYNYAGQVENCNVYLNAAQSQTFTKNNCSSGYIGSFVIYTVPSGTFTSAISQADADAKALADLATNGQAYANLNGTCSIICNTSNCNAVNKKCVNNNCETGIKIYTSSVWDPSINKHVCTYHYEWSDGSWSQNYTQYSNFPCNI